MVPIKRILSSPNVLAKMEDCDRVWIKQIPSSLARCFYTMLKSKKRQDSDQVSIKQIPRSPDKKFNTRFKEKGGFWHVVNQINSKLSHKEISHIVKIKKKLRILPRYQSNDFLAHQSKIITQYLSWKKREDFDRVSIQLIPSRQLKNFIQCLKW